MEIIITGKEFREERIVKRKVVVYPTNLGNLTAYEIAEIDGIKPQTARNNIIKGKYSLTKRRVGRPSKH